jgi:hypothetical protein
MHTETIFLPRLQEKNTCSCGRHKVCGAALAAPAQIVNIMSKEVFIELFELF